MLSAIAGSMSRAGGLTMLSAASDSVMLCATVNEVTMTRELPDRAAEQQQADEEQQVVGTDQDVVNARRARTCATTANAPWRVPAKYSKLGRAGVENRLASARRLRRC